MDKKRGLLSAGIGKGWRTNFCSSSIRDSRSAGKVF